MTQQAQDSKISLISNSDIRYDGYLHFINAEENTVGLKDVRMMGTEGRKGGGPEEVAANDQLYSFIIFRGSDIKDLTVFEAAAPPAPAVQDPAIVSATPAGGRGGAQGGRGAAAAVRGNSYAERAGGQRPAMTVQAGADRRDDRRFPAPASAGAPMGMGGRGGGGYRNDFRGGYGGRGGGRGGYRGGMGNSHYNSAPRRVHTGQDFTAASGEGKEQFQEEFDFEKAKELFEKRRQDFEQAKEEGKVTVKSYDKKSFFDTISCETKDPKGRQDREETKRADAETFGTEMVSSLRPFRRGRGGRGRYHSRF